MRKLLLVAGAMATLIGGAARATTVSDPVGDFLPTFVGDHDADLDVTSFTVDWDAATSLFTLSATLAGAINPAKAGVYVIGVDTGEGAIRPFAGIGEPHVIFDQVIAIQKTGAAIVPGHPNLTATIAGDSFTVVAPLSDFPTTGFAPKDYGFNLWPRNGLENNNQIADFAPQNAILSAAPEPATWAMMIVGVVLGGFALRRRWGAPGTAAPPA